MSFFPQLPPWGIMWLVALALYATGKCATFAAGRVRPVSFGRSLAYLLFFPGMNAATFCAIAPALPRPPLPGIRYLANVLLGALLLWRAARLVPSAHPLVQGWIGMIGLVLLLHFGLLQLVSLAWRAAGWNAPPLMKEPIRSATLTEFWSVRWNTAFRQLSHQFIFQPLARRTTLPVALFLTFAISGAVHDLVISVPAGAGFGLPTTYFLLQGIAVLLEKSRVGRRLRRHAVAARAFAIAVVTLPLPLLFHAEFVLRVFLPFMRALGALPREAFP